MSAPDWLDELAALEAAATAAPWYCSSHYITKSDPAARGLGYGSGEIIGAMASREDRAVAVAARNALPHLVRIARCAYAYRDGKGDALQFLDVLDATAAKAAAQ